MVKINKYLLQRKNTKKQLHIDLQQIASEYEKLLNKKFCYVFEGNIKTEFQFKMENFYHLLGFHKMTDVTVIRMVEDSRMKKEDFYKYIRDGKVTLSYTDEQIIEKKYQPITNFCDTTNFSWFGEIKASRLAFFTEKNVWELLLSNPVIDFDSFDNDTMIEADKIFFKLMNEKNRNLNLFIGYDQKARHHYTSTFFLEQVRDKYKNKKSGEKQAVLNILSCMVVNTMNNQIEQFIVKWENVRNELSLSPHYRAQKRLKQWISSHHIEAAEVEKEIYNQKLLLDDCQKELLELEKSYDIVCLLEKVQVEDSREDATLKLMDYAIDVEDKTSLKPYAKKDILNKIDWEKQRYNTLENKLKKHVQFLPDIKMLEKEEICLVYQPYFPELSLEMDILDNWMIQENLFLDPLNPEKFAKRYMELKKGKNEN